MTIIRKNERSWAIDLISELNSFVKNRDLIIKHIGGENTVWSERDKNWMFPDVVLCGGGAQKTILQGWEIKMPDVPIENSEFIEDAFRKATALNLNERTPRTLVTLVMR